MKANSKSIWVIKTINIVDELIVRICTCEGIRLPGKGRFWREGTLLCLIFGYSNFQENIKFSFINKEK